MVGRRFRTTRALALRTALPAVVLLVSLLLLLSACGSPGNGPRSAGATTTNTIGSYLKADADRDNDDYPRPIKPGEPNDTFSPPAYGRVAPRADRQAIEGLVKRYYAAAAAGDGARACPLLYPSVAAGLGETDPGGAGGGCSAVMTRLFRQQRAQLAADDVATMVVVAVRIGSSRGAATVGFRKAPVGIIYVKRDRRAWKIDSLLDTELT